MIRAPSATLPLGVRDEDVRATVANIAASRVFGRSDQLVRFLQFVVEETLAGRDGTLKEYRIGVEALGRAARFDPAADSVVRVQARQLRFKLAEYFSMEGRSDPVVITLPKGSYVPAFTPRTVESHALPRRRSILPFAVGALGVAAALLVAILASRPGSSSAARVRSDSIRTPTNSGAQPWVASIVVLPFVNLTGTRGDEYISDGFTDELTVALANIPELRVVARTSAFQFKGKPQDVRVIGRLLDVDAVLEGTIRRTGRSLRVNAQLNRASDGRHLWAATFDESTSNLLELQRLVADAVVGAMRTKVKPSFEAVTLRPPTRDAAAYALYLQARFLWNKRTAAEMTRSVSLFEQAIARDSTFALAYAGLAAAHAVMAVNSQVEPGTVTTRAERAARAALRLDPSLGEVHATLGLLRGFSAWDWEGAEREFRRAIELSPNNATAYGWYANVLTAQGRIDEALTHLRYAQVLDPLSMSIRYAIGEALFYARRWDEAIAQANRILEIDAGNGGAYNLLVRVYGCTGRYREALDVVRRSGDTLGVPIILALMGKHDEARARIVALTPELAVRVPYFVASMYVAIGEHDRAFHWLNRAYAVHQPDLVSMKVDPFLDPLRADPRFTTLLRRVHLIEETAGAIQ